MNRDLAVAYALMATAAIWLVVQIWGWLEDAKAADELARADAIANQQKRRPHPSAAGVLFCRDCGSMRDGAPDRYLTSTGMRDEIEIREWACPRGHANTYSTTQPTTPRRGK